MNFTDGLFPATWVLGAWGFLGSVLTWAAVKAPWRELLEPVRSNVWLGSIVALLVVWSLKAGVLPGLGFHLLGGMVLTLMFGPHLAIIALLLVLAGVTANSSGDWEVFGLNAALGVAIPILFSHAFFRAVDRHLPNHFFIYIFVVAFLGAALSMVLAGLCSTVTLVLADVYTFEFLMGNYLPYFVLMGFSEAMITGMVVTIFVVYKPAWVVTFDDTRYLLNK